MRKCVHLIEDIFLEILFLKKDVQKMKPKTLKKRSYICIVEMRNGIIKPMDS